VTMAQNFTDEMYTPGSKGGSTNGGMFAYDQEGQRAGNDLWYQIPRFYCELCGIFMDNNKPTKEHHFTGYRHRMNKEAKIREIQKKQKEKDEVNEMKNETLKLINQKAQEAYRKDLGLNPTTEDDIIESLAEWQEVNTEKGEVYYWNQKTDMTQWDKPPGWEKYRRAREKFLATKKRNQAVASSARNSDANASKRAEDVGRREAAAVGIVNEAEALRQKAFQKALDESNRKRQAETYSWKEGNEGPEAKAAKAANLSRIELLQKRHKEEEQANEKLTFDGTYTGKEDLGLPKIKGADSKSMVDRQYRAGLHAQAKYGEDMKARSIGTEQRTTASGSGLFTKSEVKAESGTSGFKKVSRSKIKFHKKK